MENFAHLGKALKWLRERAGLKQNEVALRAGITKPMMSSYEGERTYPSIGTLDKILTAIEANPFDLYEALAVVNNRPVRTTKDRSNLPEGLRALGFSGLGRNERLAFIALYEGFERWLLYLDTLSRRPRG